MASTTEIEKRKLELVQQIDESRNSVLGAKLLLDEQIAEKKASLAEALNIPKKLKRSFTEQPVKSFGIAIASGLGASLFMKRKPKYPKANKTAKRSILASLVVAAVRPIIQRAVVQYSQQWLAQRAENKFAQSQANR